MSFKFDACFKLLLYSLVNSAINCKSFVLMSATTVFTFTFNPDSHSSIRNSITGFTDCLSLVVLELFLIIVVGVKINSSSESDRFI